MALTKYKLGELLELRENTNKDLVFGENDVRGINNNKSLMHTKADLNGRDLSKFQIVYPDEFVFNHRTSRNGSKFSIALNDNEKPVICTEDYVAFKIREDKKNTLDSRWLYMFFCRSEFDRYVITNSWGSSTEFYNWEDLCYIDINLPDIDIQKKYVAIYNSLLENQKSYERGLEDLKLVCDAYIEDLRRNMPSEEIGKYIHQKSEKNIDKSIDCVMGLSTLKKFREAQSRVNRDELGGYKIVKSNDFAFVPTTDTWKVLAFAVNSFNKDIVVSPIYEVFSVVQEKLDSQYLAMWLTRKEFDRYARFHSWGSARENFTFRDMEKVKIPIPSLCVQHAISDIYEVMLSRMEISEKLKQQIKDICPILIKGSIDEGRKF